MDRKLKLYFDKSMSFDDVLEAISWNDVQFRYKNREYNITMHKSPCITVINEGNEVWESSIKNYSTYEELLLNHKFDDGVSLLDALKSKDVESC